MSDDKKQLTVAELLARAGQESGDGEVPRKRRRRRSLEEGGISVAELTGSIPAVKEKPAESKHSSVPIDAPEPEEPKLKSEKAEKAEKPAAPEVKPEPKLQTEKKPATPATDETVVLGKVSEERPEPVTDKVDRPEKPQPAGEAETGEMPVVAEPAEEQLALEGEEGDVDKHAEVETVDDDVEEKTSITGVILMAVIGVVLGVVVFKGFEMLWENLSRPIVAGLAIMVTVGMVAVVKALRTANDGLSMFLAALVGVVMTFGPLAIVLM
ncbi:MAG: hypothetical protein Q4G50_04420 [Corynebacterium sp.]|uniref:hypothetical protein n=1 Tax=Corynebacterium sp. TaxID=1720 RepID=UPI0026E02D0A|nr:hypothetical protein [Corynebacterium sp.]MDO5669224.1 hypothetical protein [Corynebacterium sp.]